jgi:hypothetical protein
MTTEKKIYWGVGIFSVVIIFGSFLIPGDRPNREDLPWHIEHPAPDTVKVFGLTLGQSKLGDAETRFKEEGEPSLFKSPAGALSAELFFEQINLAGLRSRVVLTADIPEAELKAMYERGLRMAGTGSGKKITLTPDDIAILRQDEALFLKRFGEPAQVIQEEKHGTTHWLYPQSGLDITMGGSEKPILQYVSPTEFDKLVKPLLAQTAKSTK